LARTRDFYVVADEVYHLLSWGKGERAPPPRFREVEREMQEMLSREEPSSRDSRDDGTGTTSDESDDPYAAPGPRREDRVTRVTRVTLPEPDDDDDSRVVSLGSFSKILAPGVRLGWIEASPFVIRALADRGYLSSGGCVSPLAAAVATSVVASGDQKTWLAALRARYASAAAVLAEAVSKETAATGWRMRNVPSGGYFAWIELPERCDVDAFALEAKKEKVTTLGGERCVAGEADAEAVAACGRCVRVCFAYLDEEDIKEGIRRLARAVRNSVK
jgi:DNA-binding transcriptional MocR family regulator